MSNKKGSVNFGAISGNVTFNQAGGDINQAGGDIVGRDKISTTDNSTTYNGFKKEEDKEQFINELEGLRSLIRSIKDEIGSIKEADEDGKDEITLELMNQIKALKEAKEQASNLPAGKEAPKEQTLSLTDCLENTGKLMEKAQSFGEKVAELSVKATPVLLTLKSLFGL